MKKFSSSRRKMMRDFLGSAVGAIGITHLGYPSRQNEEQKEVTKIEKGLYVVISGSGSALPDPYRGNASAAVVVDGTVLHFECGRRAMDNLMLAGINPVEVNYIFFTHLHFDHIPLYAYYVLSSWIAGREKPFKVFGPSGTIKMSNGALNGMMELTTKWWTQRTKGANPPVEVKDVGPGLVLETNKFKVSATEVSHWGEGLGTTCLGYRVDTAYGSVAYSGDTGPVQNMVDLAKGVDLLIHECTLPDPGMQVGGSFSQRVKPEKEIDWKNPQGSGHTSPSAIGQLAQRAQVKRLVPTHLPPYLSVDAAVKMSERYYGPRQDRAIWVDFVSAIKKYYQGPVIMGEDALVIEIKKA